MADDLTRFELLTRFAAVSEATDVRQCEKEGREPHVNEKHNWERAEDIVQELERLGLWPPPKRRWLGRRRRSAPR